MDSRRIFRDLARALREAPDEAEAPKPREDGEDSLDDQIDRYLSGYEAEAKNAKTEGKSYRDLTSRLLREADEEEDSDDEPAPKKASGENFDANSFANDVMRLVDNYDNLLEVKNTILRRAANHLSETYDATVVDAFKTALEENFGVEIGESNIEKEDSINVPKAAEAGPAGGGGAA